MGCCASSSSNSENSIIAPEQRYRVCEQVGEGAFGVVHVAEDTFSKPRKMVAIKYIRRCEVDKYVERELRHLCKIRHPHIVRVHEIFLLPDHLAICMEYCSGGDLSALLLDKRLPEHHARRFFQQLICAVDYCHQLGIVHRDIKLENTLLSDRTCSATVKLCDFGLSKAEDCYSLIKTRVGTPGYTAPEVLAGQPTYDHQADVWSAGILLYLMLYGKHPFAGSYRCSSSEAMVAASRRIQAGKFVFPETPRISTSARNLIRAMLERDPKQRLSIEGIMQHPWYVQSLPEGAQAYNRQLIREAAWKPPLYTEDQLKELITEARLGR